MPEATTSLGLDRFGIPKWAWPLYRPRRYKVLYGGRSSGKTWAAAQALMLQAALAPLTVACVREHQRSLGLSAKPALEGAMRQWRAAGESVGGEIARQLSTAMDGYRVLRDEIRHVNGSRFFFSGLSTVQEEDIRGWEGVSRCWIEEGHRMSERSREILYPTVLRREDSEIWVTFNPHRRTDPVYMDFVAGDWFAADRYVRKVNWSDNPYLPGPEDELRREYERSSPQRYAHVWLGEPDDGDADTQMIPYDMARACVDVWERGLAPDVPGPMHAGLDVAEGGRDLCALVVRRGPVVEHVEAWPGTAGMLGPSARRAHEAASARGATRLYYDAAHPMRGEFRRLGADYAVRPVHFGAAVGGADVLYERRQTNADAFARRNAQMGFALRLRGQRTLRLLAGEDVDRSRCLYIRSDIPRLDEYLAELSRPLWRESPTHGRIEVDKRGDGGQSPDRYDATALAFARDSERGLRARG